MIECGVRIVFQVGETEHVLALATDHFAGPFVVSGRQDFFEVEGILAADDFFRPLGGVTLRVSFEVEKTEADRAAMQAALSGGPAFQDRGELRLELPSGDHLVFAKAALVLPKVTLPTAGEARSRRRWEFMATPPTLTNPE